MRDIRIQLPVGKAEVSMLAPILGQYGFNLMDFCKKFNELVKGVYKEGVFCKVLIKMADDRTITVSIEGLALHFLIREEAKNGVLGLEQFYNILLFQQFVLKETITLVSIKMLLGTIKSMGFIVKI